MSHRKLNLFTGNIAIRLCLLALGLLIAVAACGEPESVVPPASSTISSRELPTSTPTPYPTELPPESSLSDEGDASQGTDSEFGTVEPLSITLDEGYATPSIGLRVWEADIVVLANLLSVNGNQFRFRAVEYLKGTGATEFTVTVPAGAPVPPQDERPAVLLLQSVTPAGGETARSSQNVPDFQFWSISDDYYYEGELPHGFTIDARDQLWLPESGTGGDSARGQSQRQFITDAKSPLGTIEPTISLQELRNMVAWQRKSDTEEYRKCVLASLHYQQYYRDHEYYFGFPHPKEAISRGILSGAAAGGVLYESSSRGATGYPRTWLTGEDSPFFEYEEFDDDTVASNGYVQRVSASRPLVRGTYEFATNRQHAVYMPCQYIPPYSYAPWIITVTAPADTLHEAFFDPVTIGTTIGADATNGVIDPDEFTVSSDEYEIESLIWRNNSVVLTLDDHVSLSGYSLDFIELDGSIDTTLNASDATVNQTAATWTWSLTSAPWHDGDLLMLRIREASTP